MIPRIRKLDSIAPHEIAGLCDVLIDCVEGGASVNFMWPMTREKAEATGRSSPRAWRAANARWWSPRTMAGEIMGTAQAVWADAENQPHRADISKMLVRRNARRHGVGARCSPAAERAARDAGRTLLVLDTASPKPNACTNAAAGSAWAPYRSTRCCPTAPSAARCSSTKICSAR